MKVYSIDHHDLHISNQIYKEGRSLESLSDIPEDRFLRYLIGGTYLRLGVGGYKDEQSHFFDFCKSVSSSGDPVSVAILSAHGGDFFGKWCYQDGWLERRVQGWIDQHDGRYDLLLLSVCNAGKRKPQVKESLAVIGQGNISILASASALESLILLPGKGCIPVTREKISKLPDYDLLADLQPYTPEIK